MKSFGNLHFPIIYTYPFRLGGYQISFIRDFVSPSSIFMEKLWRVWNKGKKKLPGAEMVGALLVAGNGMGRRDFSHGGNQYPLLRVFFHAPIPSNRSVESVAADVGASTA